MRIGLRPILSAAANEAGTFEYFDGNNWVNGNTLTVAENGTYLFKVTDLAGNVTEKSVAIDKIDKVAPTLEISGVPAEWTNKDVILNASVSDGTVEYFNGSEWLYGSSITAGGGVYCDHWER